jgi:hypothetical protein
MSPKRHVVGNLTLSFQVPAEAGGCDPQVAGQPSSPKEVVEPGEFGLGDRGGGEAGPDRSDPAGECLRLRLGVGLPLERGGDADVDAG